MFFVISGDLLRRPFLKTTFTSRSDFNITPVFSILKTIHHSFCCLFRSSFKFIHVHVCSYIWHLCDDFCLPFHMFSPVQCHAGLQTLIVYQREITEKKIKIVEKKVEELIIWRVLFCSGYFSKWCFFRFKNLPYRKKMLRRPICELIYGTWL